MSAKQPRPVRVNDGPVEVAANDSSHKRWWFGFPLTIAVLTALCFFPVLQNDFVNWDDKANFLDNPRYYGLNTETLRWMFTSAHVGHYQPITWLSHAVVYTIWGLDPFGYHLVNLLIHVANGVLLYALILRLLQPLQIDGLDAGLPLRPPSKSVASRSRSSSLATAKADRKRPPVTITGLRAAAAIGALFFAIHPLRVEAVAWATERREVLSSFFLLLTVLAYLRMDETRRRGGSQWFGWSCLSVACYALALLSKVMGMTLPVVLLLLDVYPLRRLRYAGGSRSWALVLAEKIPYILLAAAAAAVGLIAGAPEGLVGWRDHGLVQRLAQCAYGLCFYLWKTAVPVGLSPLYLLEHSLNPLEARYVVSAVLVLAASVALVAVFRRSKGLVLSLCAYAILVSPVLGLAQGGPQITADRYTYLSSMPLAILVAALAAQVWQAMASGTSRTAAYAAVGLITSFLFFLGVRTNEQTRVWRDSLTLWTHALHIDPSNHVARMELGDARMWMGDNDGALADFNAALALRPGYHYALLKRGNIRYLKGDLDAALADLDAAFIGRPVDALVYHSRGRVRASKGDAAGARADFDAALRIRPDFREAYYSRAILRTAQGDLRGALADYDTALRFGGHANLFNNRGTVRQTLGDLSGAAADYAEAIRLTPADAPVRKRFERNLARAQGAREGENPLERAPITGSTTD